MEFEKGNLMERMTCEACGQVLPDRLPTGVEWPKFALSLRVAMAKANVSLRDIQNLTGVDQATVHRIAKNERPIRVEAWLALSNWIATTGAD